MKAGDWLMTSSFASEWLLGLFLAQKQNGNTLVKPGKYFDFISCFPFGTLTKSLRIARFMRVLKVVRFITRANRYRGPANRFIRSACSWLVLPYLPERIALKSSNPQCLFPEPGEKPKFTTGLWWAWVTISTSRIWRCHTINRSRTTCCNTTDYGGRW